MTHRSPHTLTPSLKLVAALCAMSMLSGCIAVRTAGAVAGTAVGVTGAVASGAINVVTRNTTTVH